jgi:hypothetical protein
MYRTMSIISIYALGVAVIFFQLLSMVNKNPAESQPNTHKRKFVFYDHFNKKQNIYGMSYHEFKLPFKMPSHNTVCWNSYLTRNIPFACLAGTPNPKEWQQRFVDIVTPTGNNKTSIEACCMYFQALFATGASSETITQQQNFLLSLIRKNDPLDCSVPAIAHTVASLYNPLTAKCILGNIKSVSEHLRSMPTDIYERDEFLMTPLHWAICQKQSSITDLLIERGANLNAQDDQGNTPLHTAIYRGDYITAYKLTLIEGADICCTNLLGKTPFQLFTEHEHGESSIPIKTELKS